MPRSGRVVRIPPTPLPRVINGKIDDLDLLFYNAEQEQYHPFLPRAHIIDSCDGPEVTSAIVPLSKVESAGRSAAYAQSWATDYRAVLFDARIPLSFRLLTPTNVALYLAWELDEVRPSRFTRLPKIRKRKRRIRTVFGVAQPQRNYFFSNPHVWKRKGGYFHPPPKPLDALTTNDRVVYDPATYEVLYAGNVAWAKFYLDYFEMIYGRKKLRACSGGEFHNMWTSICRKPQTVKVFNKQGKLYLVGDATDIAKILIQRRVNYRLCTYRRVGANEPPILGTWYQEKLRENTSGTHQ